MTDNERAGLVFGGAALVLALVLFSLAVRSWQPALRTVSLAGDGTAVTLTAARDRVFFPWQCVDLTWQTFGYRYAALTRDGNVPTSGEAPLCLIPGEAGNLENGFVTTDLTLFAEDTILDTVTLRYEVIPFSLGRLPLPLAGLLSLMLAVGVFVAGGLPGRLLRQLGEREAARVGVPGRLHTGMGYALAGVHLTFVVALLATFGRGDMWFTLALMLAGAGLLWLSLTRRFRAVTAAVMERRAAALLPVVWYVVTTSLVALGGLGERNAWAWSAVDTWSALVFYWGIIYWGAAYVLRVFRFDRGRVVAWALLALLAATVTAVSILYIPYHVEPYENWWDNFDPTSGPLPYASQSNSDSNDYVGYTVGFPYDWVGRDGFPIHRPTFYMFTTRLCLLLDLGVTGYTDGDLVCSGITQATRTIWIVNYVFFAISMMVTYELVRHYLKSKGVALLAASLATVHAIHGWMVVVPSTDYSEVIIASASLWVLHRTLGERRLPWEKVLVAGFVLGMLVLLKLNATFLIFGGMLTVLLWRPKLLPGLVLGPVLMLFGYTVWIEALGVNYGVAEMSAGWPPLRWLWLTFIDLPPHKQLRTITFAVGMATDKFILFYGVLAAVAFGVMVNTRRFPRYLFNLAVLMFVSLAVFVWVFQFSYANHLFGLMPFTYGAVALGVAAAYDALRARYPRRVWLARSAVTGLFALALAHNLYQWAAWDLANRIVYGFFFTIPPA